TLTLTNPGPAAELLYSLDGSGPSLPYPGPLSISGSRTVRAAVRRAGYHAPRTLTHTYLFRDSVLASPLMNSTYTRGTLATRLRDSLTQLPTICLSVPQLPDDYNEREASIEVIMPDGSPPVQINAGLVRTGGSWTNFAKKSYRVSFRAAYGHRNLDLPLFRGFDHGIPVRDRIDTLDLSAGNHDMEARGFYMANRFVEDSMLEMGSLNPHGRFVHVYVNGTYWGQYNAHERLEDSFLTAYLGGSNDDYVNIRGNDNWGDNFVLGEPEPPNREPWEIVRANRSSYTAVKDRVDLPQMIDFMLMWFYGDCESEFRCAGPINPGSGFKFWSADADGFLRTSALTLDRTANAGPGGIFGALVAEGHPDFKILLADRIHRHFFNNGAMTPARNHARLDVRMAEIQDSLIAECARWGYRTPDNWESAAETIRTGLFPQRTTNLLSLLKNRGLYPALDAPVLSKHGGSVPEGYPLSFNSGAGTIYFTTDGTDPRLPGGGIAPGAQNATVALQTLVAMGGQWKYWDQGSLPAANWHTAAYADSGWSGGPAPLGYASGEATTISYGSNSSNKYVTSYFRKSFTVADSTAVSGLDLSLVRDDGAVIYLNGVEIIRSNMPASGVISYATRPSSAVSGDTAKFTIHNFSVPATLLIAGENLLAVEVHQINATSSDQVFDLGLAASGSPTLTLAQNTTVKARLLNSGSWSALADASFQVAHPLLAAGPYVFSQWSSSATAGSCPPAMRLFQTDLIDPPLATPMTTPWTLPFNLTSRSRISGLESDGLGFINTGTVQETPEAGFVGAAVVALDTTAAQDIRVTWTGGTIDPNDRDYGIRLQYRLGDTADFTDVADAGGLLVEYLRHPQAGHAQVIGPVTLPPITENQPLVELRWKYYFRSGSLGSRAHLRLDDIQITAGPVVGESLAIVDAPATAQAAAPCQPVTVEVRGRNGALAADFSGMITVSVNGQPGLLEGTVSRQAALGGAVFDDLVFPQAGVFTLTATASGITGATAVRATRVAGLTELMMPQFIQGASPDNSSRVPFACLLRVDGLLPNATYRYAPQFIDADDSAAAADDGAGNPILTGSTFVRCSSSPRFLATDLDLRHGEFVTDVTGTHIGWIVLEPTGNARFAAGAFGWIRLLLNDGEGGEQPAFLLTAGAPVQVLAFGTRPGDGSAVFGGSAAATRNFIVLYDDPAGTTRPLAAAPVEATGLMPDSTWAAFYQNEVAGQGGRWGTILPNNLAYGARRIEERDLATGEVVAVYTCPTGHLPTTLLGTGLQATGLRLPAPGASAFARWQASRFDLAGLGEPAQGGPAGDPDADGLTNLLEFAFGLNPWVPARVGLPGLTVEAVDGARQLVFRHRRLMGDHGLSYRIERSTRLDQWEETTGFWLPLEETQPNSDGITESVTLRHPLTADSPAGFFRLKVTEP
ncbi:MAG: CotH kinase family protein, partial [Akkermansiaceae bacterium]|nr:CotH kinase family protein [Akkermansiaceae bacterium]